MLAGSRLLVYARSKFRTSGSLHQNSVVAEAATVLETAIRVQHATEDT